MKIKMMLGLLLLFFACAANFDYRPGKNRAIYQFGQGQKQIWILYCGEFPGIVFQQNFAQLRQAGVVRLVNISPFLSDTFQIEPLQRHLKKEMGKYSGKIELVGLGIGANYALQLAQANPRKIGSLTLINPVAELAAEVKEQLKDWRNLKFGPTDLSYFFYYSPYQAGLVLKYLRNFVSEKGLFHQYTVQLEKYPYLKSAAALAQLNKKYGLRTLVIWGEKNRLFAAPQIELYRPNPSIDTVIVQQAGFLIPMDMPRVLDYLMAGFIQETVKHRSNSTSYNYHSLLSQLKKGQFVEYLQTYQWIIGLNPYHSAAHESVAETLIRFKKFDEAKTRLNALLKKDPGHLNYHYLYAVILKEEGKLGEENVKKLKNLFAAHPNKKGLRILDLLIGYYISVNDKTNAQALLRKYAQIDKDARYYANSGSYFLLDNQVGAAIDILKSGLKRYPDKIEFYYYLYLSYLKGKKRAAAEASLLKGEQLATDKYFFQRLLGFYFYDQKAYLKSVQFLKGIAEKYPQDYEAVFILAQSYMKLEDYQTALKSLLYLNEKLPQHTVTMTSIAICYTYLKEYDQAVKFNEAILKMKPDYGLVYYNLGCLYALRGEPQKALAYLKKSILNGYTDYAYMQKDSDLKALYPLPEFKALGGLIEKGKQLRPAWLKKGALLIYHLIYKGERYILKIRLKENDDKRTIDWDFVQPIVKKGSLLIKREGVLTSHLFEDILDIQKSETRDSALFVSRDLYKKLVEEREAPFQLASDWETNRIRYEKKEEVKITVNGKEETVTVLLAVTNNNNRFWILNNYLDPIIIKLEAEWQQELKAIQY